MSTSRISRFPPWLRPPLVLAYRIASDAYATILPKRKDSRRYYCRALTGESEYNICINCDMTVSCNCRDFDGSGRIGNLRNQTLLEVFSGPVTQRFLEMLYAGDLPSSTCQKCPELAVLEKSEWDSGPRPGKVPRLGIMIENTARCNLHCHLCDRQQLLGRRQKASLSLNDLDRIAAMLAANQIARVYYFNLGEPFLSPTILEEMRILRSHLPGAKIITSTNGTLLGRDDCIEATLMMDRVFFSIDGIDQNTLQRYQQGGSFEDSYANMCELIRRRSEEGRSADGFKLPIVEWKYVLFNWNDRRQHIGQAIELAKAAGVERLLFSLGEAPIRDMSLRYFSDSLLNSKGRRNEEGISFDFRIVPDELL